MSWSATLAKITSRVTNPCIFCVVVLLLIAYNESGNLQVLLSWAPIILLFLVVLPLAYVYVRTSTEGSRVKGMEDILVFFRHHPIDICVLGVVLALPCILILLYLEAPVSLLATLAGLLATSLLVALVNMFYRVSYHLAAITTLAIVAAIIWGQTFPAILATIPLVGWARYRLREHTLTQLGAGVSIAVAVVGTTLYSFGLLG